MANSGQHPREALQRMLDGRLENPTERHALQQHLETCAGCRRELVELRSLKELLTGTASSEQPATQEQRALDQALHEQLRSALDAQDAAGAAGRARRGWLWSSLAAAAVIVAAFLLWPSSVRDLPGAAAQDFADYRSGKLSLAVKTADAVQLAAYFEQHGAGRVRVIDLAMMKYQLIGGRQHQLGPTPSALYVYQGPDGRVLQCQMLRALLSDLPPPKESHDRGEFRFYVYEQNGVTSVFWQEGSVLCVLSSDMPKAELLPLAFAKAMQPV